MDTVLLDQPAEIINGQKLVEILRVLSEAKWFCRLEIPQTSYSWITLIVDVQDLRRLFPVPKVRKSLLNSSNSTGFLVSLKPECSNAVQKPF